jgi:hypothetical protein
MAFNPARAAVLIAGVAIVAGACGRTAPTTHVGAQPAATTAQSAPQPSADPNAAPQDRQSSRRTYEGGVIAFDPPAATAMAHRNRAAALQAQQKNPVFPNFSGTGSPDVKFASYTNNGSGKTGPNGAIIPDHVQQPVWVVTFHNVPDAPAGSGGYVVGDPNHPPQTGPVATVLHDFVFIIDDATGSLLSEFSANPD